MDTKTLGKRGEDVAARYLLGKGYEILGRNFVRRVSRFLKSEIDIIAKKEGVICFVEVKTLSGNRFISPEQHVGFSKKKKLVLTAESWLIKNNIPLNSKWRIDIISVILEPRSKPKISHFKNAVGDHRY